MKTKTILIVSAALLIVLLAIFGIMERHLIYLFIKVPAEIHEAKCNESLWQYNAEPEDVIQRCMYLTGTVAGIHAEEDGDYNIQLRPDPQYVPLLNAYNVFFQVGNIAVEPICEVTPKRKDFIKSCDDYHSNLKMPKKGDHIAVIGAYTHDKHRWAEIHPVTDIKLIKMIKTS